MPRNNKAPGAKKRKNSNRPKNKAGDANADRALPIPAPKAPIGTTSDDSGASTIKEAGPVAMATPLVSAAAATDAAETEPVETVGASTTADDDTTAAAPTTTPVEPVPPTPPTAAVEAPPSSPEADVGALETIKGAPAEVEHAIEDSMAAASDDTPAPPTEAPPTSTMAAEPIMSNLGSLGDKTAEVAEMSTSAVESITTDAVEAVNTASKTVDEEVAAGENAIADAVAAAETSIDTAVANAKEIATPEPTPEVPVADAEEIASPAAVPETPAEPEQPVASAEAPMTAKDAVASTETAEAAAESALASMTDVASSVRAPAADAPDTAASAAEEGKPNLLSNLMVGVEDAVAKAESMANDAVAEAERGLDNVETSTSGLVTEVQDAVASGTKALETDAPAEEPAVPQKDDIYAVDPEDKKNIADCNVPQMVKDMCVIS